MRHLWITAALAFAIDQISKYGVFYGLDAVSRGQIDVLPPLLVLRTGMNTGINFGLLSGSNMRIALIVIALVICLALVIWAKRSFHRPRDFVFAGLVLGGALGNALDRVFHAGVLDFLNMSCCGIDNPYIFNLADVFIFAGAIGIALFTSDKKPA